MYLIECTPIDKNKRTEKLTYFSKTSPEKGSVIQIPIRNKISNALVMKSSPLEKEKMNVKQAGFSLRKLGSKSGVNIFLKETIDAAEETAKFFLTNTGSVVDKFTPQIIISEKPEAPKKRFKNERFSIHTLQGTSFDRILEYKSMLRESFSKKRSMILVAPTGVEANFFFKELSKGIENYCFLIEGLEKEKIILSTWKEVINCNHPILCVVTPFALTIPRHDIGTIIIERENSRSYSQLDKSDIDGRIFAEKLAKHYGARLIIGDTTLRIETLFREESEEIIRLPTSKQRVQSNARTYLVDMKKDVKGEKKEFELFSREARILLEETINENDRCVIFTARKGTAPLTLCKDCETIVECNTCHAPVVLHERQESNYFLCHKCGERRDAKEYCKVCNSWNLTSIGIGIDRIAKHIEENYKDAKVFLISKDHVKNQKTAKQVISDFYKTPRGILIGTEMILPFLERTYENGIIASLDSLFGVPDYKINEKIFHLVVTLRASTTKNFVIQTRNISNYTLECASRGDIHGFFEKEIINRKNFFFPPFSNLIKVTIVGKRTEVANHMKELSNRVMKFEPAIFPAFTPKGNGNSSLSLLLRIGKDQSLDEETEQLLTTLPRNYRVEVNPDSII